MKITKFVHACLLIETDDHAILFDPGEMSFESGLLNIDSLPRLDSIVITHEHFDHYSEEFLRALIARFPSVTIVTTPSLTAKLKAQGITAQEEGTKEIELFNAPHESMAPLAPAPMVDNTGAHFMNILTHPGDSFHVTESKAVFAMPLAGPWGSAIEGVRMATKLKPKYVIPIHDWMWNDQWRSEMYDRFEQYFSSIGVRFIKALDGVPTSIEV